MNKKNRVCVIYDAENYQYDDNEGQLENSYLASMDDLDVAIFEIKRLSKYERGDKLLVVGSLRRWFGWVEGCKIIDDIDELCITSIKWSDQAGLEIAHSHHDGCDYYNLRILNDRGVDYLYNNGETLENLEKVSSPYYSAAIEGPRFGDKITKYFGWHHVE